ncbi:phenylacetyl-CoA:acceptor oxidoreductase accessory protein [Methylophilaceae bacterium]|nr:phenylacetyl-CoA:acceptor oxidoreductase accessory protein [Methylophilaceae bacterium]
MNSPGDVIIMAEATSGRYPVLKWDDGRVYQLDDDVAEEVPVALVYNGISHAVMLATPQDLEDFALGFSLTEGIIAKADEIFGIDIVHHPKGIELHIELASERFQSLKQRRRSMTGRTGCGLCGAESLDQVMGDMGNVINVQERIHTRAIEKAYANIRSQQQIQSITGGTHACAWVDLDGNISILREDVGRHNALDKLIGAKMKANAPAHGFVLTTSRASYELVQKVASAGIPVLVAVSAPTGLAIKTAQRCGVTLVAFARDHQHVVYSRPERIVHKEEQ